MKEGDKNNDTKISYINVSSDVTPCMLVHVYPRFRKSFYLHLQLSSSEMSTHMYQTKRRNIDSHLCENYPYVSHPRRHNTAVRFTAP